MEGSEDETESSPLVRQDATGQSSRRTRRQRDQTQREDNFARKKGWLSYFYSLCCQWKSKSGSIKTPNWSRICMAVGALIALAFLGYIAVIGIEYEVSVFSGDPSPTPSPTVSMFPSTTPVETFSPSAFSGSSTLSPSTSPASSDDADDESDDHASDDDDDDDDHASDDDDDDDDHASDDDDHASDDDDDKAPSNDDDDDDKAPSDDDDDDDEHASDDDDDDDHHASDDDDDKAPSNDDDDDDKAPSDDDDDNDHASSGDDDDDDNVSSGDDDADDHASDDTPPLSFPTVSGVSSTFPPTFRRAWGGEPTTRPSFPPGPTYRPSLRPSEGSRTRNPTVAPTILAAQRTRQPTRSDDDDSPTGQPSIADKTYYPTVTTSPPSSQSPVTFVSNP